MPLYDAFSLRKVYHCPCMMHSIKQISDLKIRRYDDRKRAAKDLCGRNWGSQVYGIRVNNKENVMFLCYVYLNIVTMSEARCDCTLLNEKSLYFESLQKRFCVGCIRHFCKKICLLFHYFEFVYFDFVNFEVDS